MADTKSTLTWLLRDEVSGPARKINDVLDAAGKKAGTSGGLFDKLGKATGGLLNPTTLAVGAVGLLAGGIGEAIKAASDEQKNIEKLSAALTASVPGWNGNTDAIEALISKREDLAFSDDELRDSMAILVTSTHDVTEAQNLQATAMDLARFKGVDLATASTAIAKATQGSTKELKALGITVDDTKDKTAVLAAVQKATAGQAAAYAGTMGGKWETFNNKLGDVVEKIGDFLLPIVEKLMDFLNDTAIPAISQMADLLGPVLTPVVQVLGGVFDIVGKGIGWFVDHIIKPAIDTIGHLIDFVKSALKFLGILHDEPIPSGPTSSNAPGSPDERRATGGVVVAGHAYTVGEEGTETLIMGAGGGGYVVPGGGGADRQVVILLQVDGRTLAKVVDRNLYYQLRRSSPSVMSG